MRKGEREIVNKCEREHFILEGRTEGGMKEGGRREIEREGLRK